jgi:hypothetical protein
MKNRIAVSTMVVALSLIAGQAVYASPVAVHSPVHATFGHPKTISFTVRNDAAQSMKLKAGDQEMTLAAGKTLSVKLPVGVSVVLLEATASTEAGKVLITVAPELQDAIVGLK